MWMGYVNGHREGDNLERDRHDMEWLAIKTCSDLRGDDDVEQMCDEDAMKMQPRCNEENRHLVMQIGLRLRRTSRSEARSTWRIIGYTMTQISPAIGTEMWAI